MSLRNKEIDIMPRPFMARIVFGWLAIVLLYFFINNSLVHQWHQPVLIYPKADNLFWLTHMLNIPQTIMRSETISIIFDILIVLSTVLFIFYPRLVLLCILSNICFWLFQIMYGSSNGHHYHHVGYLIVPLAFIFRNPVRFSLSWQLVRYWILFLYASSAVYKFYYGGYFYDGNMAAIFQAGSLGNTDSMRSDLILYLVNHPGLAQLLYQCAAIIQLVFVIGFFSRKYDLWLGAGFLFFHLCNYLLLHISFWENSVALAVFLPWNRIPEISRIFRTRITNKKSPPFLREG